MKNVKFVVDGEDEKNYAIKSEERLDPDKDKEKQAEDVCDAVKNIIVKGSSGIIIVAEKTADGFDLKNIAIKMCRSEIEIIMEAIADNTQKNNVRK